MGPISFRPPFILQQANSWTDFFLEKAGKLYEQEWAFRFRYSIYVWGILDLAVFLPYSYFLGVVVQIFFLVSKSNHAIPGCFSSLFLFFFQKLICFCS